MEESEKNRSIAYCVWECGPGDTKVCVMEFINAPAKARAYADRCARRSGKAYVTSAFKLPMAA